MKPAATGRARHHAVAALLLAALVGGFWVHNIYVERPTRSRFLSSDLTMYFYPTTLFLHDEVRAGRLPTWNPYQMAGYPFLAAQITGVLYPPNLLFAVALPPARALEAHALFHLLVSGFFTWLFARRVGLGPIPSFAGAAVLMLSSEMVQRTYNPAYLGTAAWLPALFWSTHGLLTEGRWRWVVALGVAGAFSFLGGNTQGAFYLWQATALFWAFGLWVLTPRARRLHTVALTLCAAVLTFSLIAPQLLPTLELVRSGVRGLPGLSPEEAGFGSLRVRTLLLGALGMAQGTFVTPLAVALIPLGFADRERRWLWLFLVVAASLVGLLMLGDATPVWRVYYALPLGNLFRIPTRASVLWVFLLSLLAAVGVQGLAVLCERLAPRTHWLSRGAVGVLALVLVADAYQRADLRDSMPVLWNDYAAPGGLRHFVSKRHGMERVFIEDLAQLHRQTQAKLGTIYRRFVVPDYEPLMPRAYAELFQEDRLWHGRVNLRSTTGKNPVETVRALDLMSVRQYVAPAGRDRLVQRMMTAALGEAPTRRGEMWIANRSRALPRAYAVERTRLVLDSNRARRVLVAAAFDPRREAVVDGGKILDGEQGTSPPSAEIRSYSPQEVVIDATCGAPCLLVLTDLHYPGWEAWVDGERAEVVRTNLAFRGVFLDAGTHRVVHRFRPKSLWLGLGIAAAGLVAVGAVAFLFRRRESAAATEPESARARSAAC